MSAVEIAVLKEIAADGPGHAQALNERMRDKKSPFASYGLKHILKGMEGRGLLISSRVAMGSENLFYQVVYDITDTGKEALRVLAA